MPGLEIILVRTEYTAGLEPSTTKTDNMDCQKHLSSHWPYTERVIMIRIEIHIT